MQPVLPNMVEKWTPRCTNFRIAIGTETALLRNLHLPRPLSKTPFWLSSLEAIIRKFNHLCHLVHFLERSVIA